MIARIPVGLCFLCSLFQKQACIRKTDTKSTRTICPFFCAQHPHGCFWGEKQTDCFHVCSKKLLQHVGFDCCNCGLLWQLASGHNGARTPHGGTNLCFHGIFKDSLSSYSQHQTAIDHLVTIKLNALPLLKCGLFKMYPIFYNCDSLHSTGLKCQRYAAQKEFTLLLDRLLIKSYISLILITYWTCQGQTTDFIHLIN